MEAGRQRSVSTAYLDTHVAVYLHDGLIEELSSQAKRHIEENDLVISPIVLLELEYLFTRKRISIDSKSMWATLATTFGIAVCPFPFAGIVHESLDLHWTTDPFDRLIVGHARANASSPLITRDRLIRRHYQNAVW